MKYSVRNPVNDNLLEFTTKDVIRDPFNDIPVSNVEKLAEYVREIKNPLFFGFIEIEGCLVILIKHNKKYRDYDISGIMIYWRELVPVPTVIFSIGEETVEEST